ncbi:Protein CBG13734 [Caenorhabditis briggsae]|uniref:Protein CBG13734 n=1 Tax=Caenorhabditis briggsae TaxID=6238 RepID=A8XIK5_CAEBR|nr:Protein CBG13734 [Caenorhabditis briggsae]CAP32480.1 Protein CBG13734 [Caenorhabditis briggsae]
MTRGFHVVISNVFLTIQKTMNSFFFSVNTAPFMLLFSLDCPSKGKAIYEHLFRFMTNNKRDNNYYYTQLIHPTSHDDPSDFSWGQLVSLLSSQSDAESVLGAFATIRRRFEYDTKMSCLIGHFMPCARRFGTLGRMSEQSIESFHALFNRLQDRFKTVRNDMTRYTHCFRVLLFFNHVFMNS